MHKWISNRTYLTDHFLIIVAPQMLKYIRAILWNPFNITDLCYLNEINNAKRNHLIILYELFNETFPLIIIQYRISHIIRISRSIQIFLPLLLFGQWNNWYLYVNLYVNRIQSIQKWNKNIIFFALCVKFVKIYFFDWT